VVTRSAQQAATLEAALRAVGAEPVRYPTIAYAPPANLALLDDALWRIQADSYDWLVLTSTTGVRYVRARMDELGGAVPLPPTLRLAAVGSTTAKACTELLGTTPHVVPDTFTAEALAAALGDMHGQRVLLAQANLARPVLADTLRAAGAVLDAVVAYRTISATGGADVPALLAANQIDAITFTSGSTVRFFLERIGPEYYTAARRTIIACIGPITAETARTLGLPPQVVATPATIDGLIDALVQWRLHAAQAST
jgi:uroporphyrinogen-III synthase